MDTLDNVLLNSNTVESNNAYKKDNKSMPGNLAMATLARSSSRSICPWR